MTVDPLLLSSSDTNGVVVVPALVRAGGRADTRWIRVRVASTDDTAGPPIPRPSYALIAATSSAVTS